MQQAVASEYGPGLWGNGTACGQTLQYGTIGVAHKYLKCGTVLTICYHGCIVVSVIDRGPYVSGRDFDLTMAAANRIGFSGVHSVSWRQGR